MQESLSDQGGLVLVYKDVLLRLGRRVKQRSKLRLWKQYRLVMRMEKSVLFLPKVVLKPHSVTLVELDYFSIKSYFESLLKKRDSTKTLLRTVGEEWVFLIP